MDKEVFEGEDLNGNIVKFYIKTPGPDEIKKSQVVYNTAFKEALDSGALLRQKLTSYMEEQELWDEDKQAQYEKMVEDISEMEDSLKAGGIRLSMAKEVAMNLRKKREDFRTLISQRNSLDAASAEGQADNVRFEELVRLCTMNPDNNKPYFPTKSDYTSASSQPWVVNAAEKLGNAVYGLDSNYEKNLTENKFLQEFNYVDGDLRFINDDGHNVDVDGKLVDEDGRYVAYNSDSDYKDRKNPYYVNRDGEKVVEVDNEWVKESIAERKPFLDDNDCPIEVSSKDEKPAKPKRRTRKTKTDPENV